MTTQTDFFEEIKPKSNNKGWIVSTLFVVSVIGFNLFYNMKANNDWRSIGQCYYDLLTVDQNAHDLEVLLHKIRLIHIRIDLDVEELVKKVPHHEALIKKYLYY